MTATAQSVDNGPYLDPHTDEFLDDPYPYYARLQDEAPLYRNDEHNFYALTRYVDVRDALTDWERFTSTHGQMLAQLNMPGFKIGEGDFPGWFGMYDPPAHGRWRRPVNPTFSMRHLQEQTEEIAGTVRRYFDELGDTTELDIAEDLYSKIPGEVIHTWFGVPEADREEQHRNSQLFLSSGPEGPEAIMAMIGYFAGLAEDRKKTPQPDLITHLCETEIVDEHGVQRPLRPVEVAHYCLLIITGGSDTTSRLLSSATVQFSRNPGEWRKVVENPETIPAALEEAGRIDGPAQYMGRRSTKEITLHGQVVPAGSNFLMFFAAGNRDPRVFFDPARFDIDRDLLTNRPLTFGAGPHQCLGMSYARLVSRLVVAELRARYESWEVDDSALGRARTVITGGFDRVPVQLRPRKARLT